MSWKFSLNSMSRAKITLFCNSLSFCMQGQTSASGCLFHQLRVNLPADVLKGVRWEYEIKDSNFLLLLRGIFLAHPKPHPSPGDFQVRLPNFQTRVQSCWLLPDWHSRALLPLRLETQSSNRPSVACRKPSSRLSGFDLLSK